MRRQAFQNRERSLYYIGINTLPKTRKIGEQVIFIDNCLYIAHVQAVAGSVPAVAGSVPRR